MLEILFALYEKYLLLSGRVGVYFHPGAVKSRQSASCWRQPILNPIFPLFILPPRSIHINGELWTSLIELHFQYSKAELLPGQIFTNDSSYSRYLCKGNGSNQTELAIITGDINVKLFTQPRSFWEREYCFRHVGPQRHHKSTTKAPQRHHKGTTQPRKSIDASDSGKSTY